LADGNYNPQAAIYHQKSAEHDGMGVSVCGSSLGLPPKALGVVKLESISP
jgi:hypothetical protein